MFPTGAANHRIASFAMGRAQYKIVQCVYFTGRATGANETRPAPVMLSFFLICPNGICIRGFHLWYLAHYACQGPIAKFTDLRAVNEVL